MVGVEERTMSLNFPASPAPGQVFTAEGRSFAWNGAVWLMQPTVIPWATNAEALEGTRADRAMSPALTRLRTDAIQTGGTENPLSGTPVDVLAQRAVSIAYQNPFDRPMVLSVWAEAQIVINIGATAGTLARFLQSQRMQAAAASATYVFGLIPPRWWYSVGGGSLFGWVEYR
jgi:hypothetical protein